MYVWLRFAHSSSVTDEKSTKFNLDKRLDEGMYICTVPKKKESVFNFLLTIIREDQYKCNGWFRGRSIRLSVTMMVQMKLKVMSFFEF